MLSIRRLLRATAPWLALVVLLYTPSAWAMESPKGGLFFKTSRPGVYYEAPLLRTDVAITVSGTVIRATVRQHFVNPSNAWLEGVYVFPLPERAAVDRLVMEVGGRRIAGEIKERQQAEKIFKEAAVAGQRASLVSSERPNIFTTAVANIGPGQMIVVEIGYQDAVAVEAGRYSLRFPMVVGPRYKPGGANTLVADRRSGEGTTEAAATAGAPDADRITPPVLQPGQGNINPVALTIQLDAGFPLDEVVSRYHAIASERLDERRTRITLTEGNVPADRDFLLEWRPTATDAPRASLFAESKNGDVYLLAIVQPPTAAAAAARPPRDVVFVIDTSGSMGGTSIVQARRALALALDRLTPGDRFNIIEFNSVTTALFDDLQPHDAHTLRQAQAWVAGLDADGGTEMRPALRLALAGATTPGRLRQVVFLTDAAIGNEAELFEDIAQRLGDSRLFTIGIGTAPNSYFMRKAAELGRGSFTYIGDVSEVAERMGELLHQLERPALTGLAVRWPSSLVVEMYPATLPDLYHAEPIAFTARLSGLAPETLAGEALLTGLLPDRQWADRLDLSGLQPAAGVAALWARSKLEAIEDQQWRGKPRAEVDAEATAQALAYGLVSRYTSLVAVDREVVRPQDAALSATTVPTNMPAGWDYAKVFGPAATPAALPAPSTLMREIDFTGTPMDVLALPRTATPAQLQALLGLALLALAGALILRNRFATKAQEAPR
jgi:Ca-activated chloride channel family protein